MAIDKKDSFILQALDKDVRASYAQIGRQTRLSKEVVQYRIKQLEKKKILTGFWAIPRIGSNNNVYKLLLKNKSLTNELKKEFIKFCLENKAVSWFAQTEGSWDYVISSYIKEDSVFTQFINDIMVRFGPHFNEKHILKSTGMISLNEKYLYSDNKTIRSEEDSFLEPFEEPDHKDNAIIRMLSHNARVTFSEMGKELGMTPEAISARYRQIMKKKLIIGMNPRINHKKLGLEYYHMFISINNYEKKDAIIQYYTQHPSCVFIMKHVGYYDLHLEIVIPQIEVESFVDDLTGTFGEDISSYELLRIQKEHIMIVTR